MANDRQEGDARKPPRSDDRKKQQERDGQEKPKRERHHPTNDEVDEGLEETFPASDPPAHSRPTGAK